MGSAPGRQALRTPTLQGGAPARGARCGRLVEEGEDVGAPPYMGAGPRPPPTGGAATVCPPRRGGLGFYVFQILYVVGYVANMIPL